MKTAAMSNQSGISQPKTSSLPLIHGAPGQVTLINADKQLAIGN